MESSHGLAARRPDRKIIEKNRRIHMKALFSKLECLLPSTSTNAREGGTTPLPEMIDEVINYIKGLQESVRRMEERKRQLTSSGMAGEEGSLSKPRIEVQDLGSGLQVTVISRGGDRLKFSDVVRVLEEEGAEILTASYVAMAENLASHTIHSLISKGGSRLEVSKVLEGLKMAAYYPC